MNEWAFAAEIKSWWDAELSKNPKWRLTRCEVEHSEEGERKRADLVVFARGVVRLCGELRLPDHPVASPWHPDNLADAIDKATRKGARWAFTSDSTRLLLIDTRLSGPPAARVVQDIEILQFSERGELDSEAFLARLRVGWLRALDQIAPITARLVVPPGMAPDEAFINALHALLAAPVAAIRDELDRRRLADSHFADGLVKWMVDAQGWTHVPEHWELEVLRTARLTAYVFTTRLMFYEALRRTNTELPPLDVPDATASIARRTLQAYFDDAQIKSGDYETLFTWDTVCEFGLNADDSISAWKRVIAHLVSFDLTNIGYDILGRMFERLIDPTERYRWGQHYTSPDVVDLMLSFALPDGRGKVLDPAVGGGTFLVRGYVRKRLHEPDKSHQEILEELYGIDTSTFAASLATVNLAVRDLRFGDNYPLVTARSFFSVNPADALMSVPTHDRVELGRSTPKTVSVGRVRAVVCNPPYVRLHELGVERQEEAQRAIGQPGMRVPAPVRLHGLSNYHIYFWLHAAQFLEDRGCLALITAGEWLDSDYGAPLQAWLLNHFAIECCVESLAEPWFSEARVGTVVIVARLCDDEEERNRNVVRFVLLRKKLRELYGNGETDPDKLMRVDRVRDAIMRLKGAYGETEEMDWSSVAQAELWKLGRRSSEVTKA